MLRAKPPLDSLFKAQRRFSYLSNSGRDLHLHLLSQVPEDTADIPLASMFEDFTYRHIPSLFLGIHIAIGGLMPWTHGPRAALLKFGFPPSIASSPAAWPLIKVGSARITAFGLALCGMYAGGHYEAMDILIASMGWIGLVDGWVCYEDGAEGSVVFRSVATASVAVWGALGMTTGKYL